MTAREFIGQVVSDKPNKTVVVQVERRVAHAKYKKFIRRRAKFHAHDENNEYKVGDKVRIRECRPISKLKTWQVVSRVD